jgi:integrase/recombinase XerD
MEMKAKALASVDIIGVKSPHLQRALPSLMAFLKAL